MLWRRQLRVSCNLSHKHLWTALRTASSSAGNNAFSETLHLPRTKFPLRQNDIAPYVKRTCEDLYDYQSKNAKGDAFVFLDGPPYANGNLHMGHALNKILKDIINRFQVSQGRRVRYHPGWDCHGLPIENKALQELKKDPVGLPAEEIRHAARNTAHREVANQMEQFKQLGIMANWGQDTTYRTMDHSYEIRQLRVFQQMVKKGLIYRHHRPVYFSPSSRSALAEAELIYKDDHISHSVYVAFKLDAQSIRETLSLPKDTDISALVWTTTPWTLTANMGIAVNEDVTYSLVRTEEGKHYIVAADRLEALLPILGKVTPLGNFPGSELLATSYIPIFDTTSTQRLPFVAADHVTADSGTGLVHCAPSHGAEDYLTFKFQGLIRDPSSMICHVDGSGSFSPSVADVVGDANAAVLVGQPVLEGGSRGIVDILKGIGNGALVKIQRYKHRYPYDWKTDKPVIVTATSQWFANLDGIKESAVEAMDDVQFVPPISRNRLESFTRSRSEWCISRQRVWGVPIPALHNIQTGESVLTDQTLSHILSVLEEKGVKHWWDGPVADFIPPSLHTQEGSSGLSVEEVWRKDTDTMDVWFDSGTSWSALAHPKTLQRAKGRKFYADVCLEGTDQHRGWFQSQLLTSIGCAVAEDGVKPASPYGTLITHGMVLDQDGKKMSKSLGNIVSPMTVIKGGKDLKKEPPYGTDGLRLWAASVDYWNDMSIGPTVLKQVDQALKKIRYSARFILGNIGDAHTSGTFVPVPREQLGLAGRYVMSELYDVEQTALEGYRMYNFPKVVNSIARFTNVTLSSLYFDIMKDTLYADALQSHERRAAVTVLHQVLETMTSIISPITPYLAEEIHDALVGGTDKSVMCTPWVPLGGVWKDVDASKDMATLLRVREAVLLLLEKARAQKLIGSSLEADVDLILPPGLSDADPILNLLRREESFLKTLFITSDARFAPNDASKPATFPWSSTQSLDFSSFDRLLNFNGPSISPAAAIVSPSWLGIKVFLISLSPTTTFSSISFILMLSYLSLAPLLLPITLASPAPTTINDALKGGQSIPVVKHRHTPRSGDDLAAWAKSNRDNLIAKYGGKPKTKRSSGLNLLADQGADSSYYGSLAIGTPPVSYYVILDTGSADLWVADQKCTSGCSKVPTFNAADSSSYQNLSTPFSITYGSGAATGNLGQDTIQMAGFSVENQTFATTDQVTSGVLTDPVSGIMGLAWEGISASHATPFWQTLAEGGLWDEPVMAFQLTRYTNDSQVQQLEPGGTFNMGTTNTSLYTGDIEYTNLVDGDNTYWLLEISSLTVQGNSITLTSGRQSYAAIDTGTTLVGGPSTAIANIFAQIPGSAAATGSYEGYYTYPCSTDVNVEISFGGKSWSVSPADFKLTALDKDTCLGAFFDLNVGGSSPAWIVGDTFLKNVYTVFRYNPASVGFAALSDTALAMNGAAGEPPSATIGSIAATATGQYGGASSLRSSSGFGAVSFLLPMAGALLGACLIF